MNRRTATIALAFALLLAAGAGRSQQAGGGDSSWDRYKVIVDRNIFLPERSRPVQRAPAPVVQRPAEPDIYLTGVAVQGDHYIAVVEDRRAGTISRVRVGDETPQGRITAITLDHIACEKDGESSEVRVGARFASASATGPAAGQGGGETAAGSPSESAAPERPSEATGGTAADILERMRQRRQRELE